MSQPDKRAAAGLAARSHSLLTRVPPRRRIGILDVEVVGQPGQQLGQPTSVTPFPRAVGPHRPAGAAAGGAEPPQEAES